MTPLVSLRWLRVLAKNARANAKAHGVDEAFIREQADHADAVADMIEDLLAKVEKLEGGSEK
jgi:hypothetical protein